MMVWIMKDGVTPEVLGFIPSFLSEADERPAAEQFNAHYQSGWRHQPGMSMRDDGALLYPGDPPLEPIAETTLRDETIRFYPYAYVSVQQADGSFEACRMD